MLVNEGANIALLEKKSCSQR